MNEYYTRLNYTTNSSSVSVPVAYTNYQGNNIFLMEDIGGTTDTRTMTLTSINITDYTSLSLKALVAAQHSGSAYETTKHISFYANIDGAGEVLIGSFRGKTGDSPVNEYLYKDDNLNGTIDAGENTVLTSSFTEYNFNVSGAGTSLVITIKCILSTANEEGAYDNLRVIAGGVLPVELTSFTAKPTNNTVQLSWRTATEVNNFGFEIERASTSLGMTWDKKGFIQGHGNSNSPKSYTFTDVPNGGTEFKYRLKQIDFDGKYEYSPEVTVNLEVPAIFSVKQNFPNPFNPTTKIEFAVPIDNNVEIKVFNVLGMEVVTLLNEHRQVGTHSIEFNASNLASGIYFYKITSGKFSEIKKMILLR